MLNVELIIDNLTYKKKVNNSRHTDTEILFKDSITRFLSDYQVTETDSTELSVRFRGKPIVTTILDSSVKEITATEFSTETRVDTQLVTR